MSMTDGTNGNETRARSKEISGTETPERERAGSERRARGETQKTRDTIAKILGRREARLGELRSSSAPTSPVRNIGSYDFRWDENEARSIKRRREDEMPREDEEAREGALRLAKKVRDILAKMDSEIRIVSESAKERNTKKDIKDAAAKLRSLVSILMTGEVQELLQELGRPGRKARPETGQKELLENITKLELENLRMKEENDKLKKDIKKLIGESAITPEMITPDGGYEGYKRTSKLKWPSNFYKAAFRAEGSPLKANKGTDLVMLVEDRSPFNEGIGRAFLERFSDLRDLEGKVSAIETTTRSLSDGGQNISSTRWVFRAEIDRTEEDWFDALRQIKDLLTKGNRTKVAIYPPEWDKQGTETRKILEYLYRDTGIKCLLHVRNENRKTKGGNDDRRPKVEAEAIIIKQEGKSYVDMLKTLREKVKPNSMAARAIRTIRETKNGNMMLTIAKHGQGDKEELKRELAETRDLKIVMDSSRKLTTIFVRGIDAVTTTEEVKEGIIRETGCEEKLINMGELRKSFGGNRIVTVRLPSNEAKTLLSKGGMRLGLSWCPAIERVEVTRCFRCWQYGHWARECKEPVDRSNLCRICGGSGHQAAACKNEERCLTCEKPGHSTGSGGCQVFREALARARSLKKPKSIDEA